MQTVEENTVKQTDSSNRRKRLKKKLFKRIGVVRNGADQTAVRNLHKIHFDDDKPVKPSSDPIKEPVLSVPSNQKKHLKVKAVILQENSENKQHRSREPAPTHVRDHELRKSKPLNISKIRARRYSDQYGTDTDDNDGNENTHCFGHERLSGYDVLTAENIELSHSRVQQPVDDLDADQSRVFHSRLSFTTNDAVRLDGLSYSNGPRKRHRRRSFSDVTPEVDKGYMPSWLDDETKGMDRRGRLSKNSIPSEQGLKKKSHSVSDLRDIGAQKKEQVNIFSVSTEVEGMKSKDHVRIEEEYLRLRRQINVNSDPIANLSQLNSSISSVRNSTFDSPASNQSMPRDQKASMLESDELGINHFRKHIQNVKQTSKRFRRSLKNTENITQKQTRRKLPSRFIPIYED